MVYMITYDLNKQGQDYENVIQAIRDASNGAYCSYWKSSYLIQSNIKTADEVLSKIKPFLDENDKILIIEVKNHKQGLLLKKEWEYINNSIFG